MNIYAFPVHLDKQICRNIGFHQGWIEEEGLQKKKKETLHYSYKKDSERDNLMNSECGYNEVKKENPCTDFTVLATRMQSIVSSRIDNVIKTQFQAETYLCRKSRTYSSE